MTIIIAVTHVWAASVAWAFYDAGNRIFVGAEGADTGAGRGDDLVRRAR